MKTVMYGFHSLFFFFKVIFSEFTGVSFTGEIFDWCYIKSLFRITYDLKDSRKYEREKNKQIKRDISWRVLGLHRGGERRRGVGVGSGLACFSFCRLSLWCFASSHPSAVASQRPHSLLVSKCLYSLGRIWVPFR